ncbi:MAG: L,D-transpeptidase [Negativicutes bacterium]|nr:L,D-transpeptidase [Negativicutes bacterium]
MNKFKGILIILCAPRKIFKVLSLMLVLSLLSVSVGLAASKPATSQEATKASDKSQSSKVKSPTSQETSKAPDKTQNSEVKPPASQEAIKGPDHIQGSEAEPPVSQIAKEYDKIIKSEPLLIIVDKSKYKLHLFKEGKEIKSYDVAIGKNPGQKERVGDMTTPTGDFQVDEIIDASYWTHDFNDGNGEIEGAYGPWFISLETGWIGIGIHGTHDPSSIKTMASEGCIRMNNDKVAELKALITVGTKVVVVTS